MRADFTKKGIFAALLALVVLFLITFCCDPIRTWGTPEPIDDCSNTAVEGQLAMNAESKAFAIWRGHDADDANSTSPDLLWVNRFDGIAWDQAMPLSDVMWSIRNLQIAMNDNGNAVAVWLQKKDNNQDTGSSIVSRYFNGSAWGSTLQVMNIGPDESYGPVHVGMDAEGKATAVWLQSGNILASRFDGTSWSSAVYVNDGSGILQQWGGTFCELQFATNAAGNGIALWEQKAEDGYYILANRFDGAAWGTAEPISISAAPSDIYSHNTQIAINESGHALAVWARLAEEDGYDIWANRFDGTTWGTAMVIEQMPKPSSNFQIALSAADKAVVVWHYCYGCPQWPVVFFNVWSKHFDGTSWAPAEQISTNGETGNATSPQIAMDADGNAMVAWSQMFGDNLDERTPSNIYVRQFDGAAWGAARTIDRSANDAGPPLIGMDADGNAIVIWGQMDDNGNGCVWANRFE